MKKWIILFGVVGAILGVVIAALLMTGPEMKDQPNIRAYQARESLPPAGVIPVEAVAELPSASAASTLANPLPATADNLVRGSVYYRYYCLACHGAAGDGNGPVGQSFLPPPADLRSAKLRELSDGQLLHAMLTGVGHRPALTSAEGPVYPPERATAQAPQTSVIEYTVPSEQRWYLVLYIRSLER